MTTKFCFTFKIHILFFHNKIEILLNLTIKFNLSNVYIFFCERHHGERCFLKHLFIYLGFYITFNTVQVIS